jgi:hypothetical protein
MIDIDPDVLIKGELALQSQAQPPGGVRSKHIGTRAMPVSLACSGVELSRLLITGVLLSLAWIVSI